MNSYMQEENAHRDTDKLCRKSQIHLGSEFPMKPAFYKFNLGVSGSLNFHNRLFKSRKNMVKGSSPMSVSNNLTGKWPLACRDSKESEQRNIPFPGLPCLAGKGMQENVKLKIYLMRIYISIS